MADKEIKITTLTEQQREVLKSKTPFILPDNPSQKGYSASQIKKTMYEPVLLLFDWLKRQGLETKEAVEEINAYLNSIDTGLKDNVEKLQEDIDTVDTKLDQTKTELTNEIKRVENAVNTEAMNELKNDLNLLKGQVSSNYVTLDNKINSSGTEQKAYTDTKVNELRLSTNSAIEDIYSHISNIGTASFEIVGSVEEVTESNVIYLIKDEEATGNDIYKEYILIDGVATLIGDTTMDVSNLATKDELETRLKKLYVTQTSRDVRFDIVFDLISKAITGLYIVNDFFIVNCHNLYSNFYEVTILSMPSHEIVKSSPYSSETLPSNLEEIVLNVVKESIEDNSITKNKLSVELQNSMVELVEVPNSVIAKLMSSTELVQLTDEEFAIFEHYENKRYVATLNGISIFFTPINRQIMDEIDVLILDNPSMWIAIVLDTKQAQKKENPINSDYNYLQRRVTEAEENIEKKVDQTYIEEQLGNIDEVLDEINGSGTTSGGGSSSSGSLTWEEIIFNIDKNVWTQNSEENYVCTDANTITEFNNILITLYEKKYIMSEVWLNMAGSGQEPLYVILNCHGGLSYLGTSSQKAPYAINFTSSHEGKTMCFAMYLSLDENNLIGSSQMSDLLSVSSAVFKIYYID